MNMPQFEEFSDFDMFTGKFLVSKCNNSITETEKETLEKYIRILSRNLSFGDTCITTEDTDIKTLFIKSGIADDSGDKPVVIEKNRIYFQKLWKYENELASLLKKKASIEFEINDDSLQHINTLFPKSGFQKIAAITAISKGLSVISGGPGTGKTTTVAKIIDILLLEPHCNIAVTAPTGKAVVRVQQSINEALKNLPLKNKDKFPSKAETVHKLLGMSREASGFRFNAENPLPYDTVIVDEVSMVDIFLMKSLLDALKEKCRIILIGDKDQLESVEAGAVLGEICSIGEMNRFTEDFAKKYNLKVKTTDNEFLNSFVELKENFRFGKNSDLNKFSISIKESDLEEIEEILFKGKDIEWLDISEKFPEKLENLMLRHFYEIINAGSIETAFNRFNDLIVLTPYKTGNFSVEFFNTFFEKSLFSKGIISGNKSWYQGKPIVINGNDYDLNIYNGDIGIFFNKKVYFRNSENLININPHLINNYSTCYALTVHKSQGSEFKNVIFCLGARDSFIMNKALIYTAVTRAREKVYIYGDKSLFKEALKRDAKRVSGLKEKLIGI